MPYLAELARVGVRPTNPDAITDDALTSWSVLRPAIVELRGGGRSYAPLFAGFPDKVPVSDNAQLRFWLAGFRLATLVADRTAPDGEASVATSVTFDADDISHALDFSSFGWWPASSVPQNIEADMIAKAGQEMLPSDNRIEWLDITFVTRDELLVRLESYLHDCLYAASALRAEVRADVATLVDVFGLANIDVAQIRIAETRALLTARLFTAAANDRAAGKQLIASGLTPDDVLRMLATITDSDVSLHAPMKFPKMTRNQRRIIMGCLQASPRIGDMYRRRDLWLAVTKSIHAGDYTDRFPIAAAAVAELRSTRYDRESVLSTYERHLVDGDVTAAVEVLCVHAPTLLIRNVRRLAALAAGNDTHVQALAVALEAASQGVPLRTLLAARAQIIDNGATYPRLAITKAGGALVIDRKPGHLALERSAKLAVLDALDAAIAAGCVAKGSWVGETVWADSATETLLIPDQLRSTSDSLLTLERGSRVRLPTANVLRLFVHWRQGEGESSDLDLSCVALDENFRVVEQVSWTNLANGAMTHSGDLTSAPNGASEFIDIDLAALSASNWRYLAPSIFKFSGPRFGDLPEAVAGWMLRDDCSTDRKTFDIATVANAFALTGSAGTAMPFVYDIDTADVLYLDAYLPARPGARVENHTATTERLGSAAATRHKIKANVAELARIHARARGAVLVTDRADATITFGVDDTATFNALRPSVLLAELL